MGVIREIFERGPTSVSTVLSNVGHVVTFTKFDTGYVQGALYYEPNSITVIQNN